MVHYFSHKKLSYVERVSNGNGSNKFEELFLSMVSNYSSTPIACFHARVKRKKENCKGGNVPRECPAKWRAITSLMEYHTSDKTLN